MSAKPSHLFYQGRERKPVLDQARGVYMWDVDGKRYLDGSSGAMVCNFGHSNENVLEAMRRQMLTDPHSPPNYRVNGIVRNFDAWYAAFGVTPDNALYLPPEQRIKIW